MSGQTFYMYVCIAILILVMVLELIIGLQYSYVGAQVRRQPVVMGRVYAVRNLMASRGRVARHVEVRRAVGPSVTPHGAESRGRRPSPARADGANLVPRPDVF